MPEPSREPGAVGDDAIGNATSDFIFGTLATDDLRLQELRDRARGLRHEGRSTPIDPEPGQPVRIEATVGTNISASRLWVFPDDDSDGPGETTPLCELSPAQILWDMLSWSYVQRWSGELPAHPDGALVRYRVVAETFGGERIGADPDSITGEPAHFAYAVDRQRVPDWIRDAVIYHVFGDRFAPDAGREWLRPPSLDGTWGGTIRGITERLPYLAELGITCLWLSPVFPSPTHHGYDATDYVSVEPRLGTESDLQELFAAAHGHGIRVLLDFVANHLSDAHLAFQRAVTDPNAPERRWFTFFPDGDYRSFFGVRSMPQINTDDPSASSYLIDAARFWLEAGADGFRLDYANGPSHAFWAMFRRATRAVKPESLTIGEVVETAELQASYLGRLDGTLDFLLLQQLRAFLAFDLIGPAAFHRFLERHLAYFPSDFTLPSFLDNHDMNRFLWVVGGDKRRLKLAALLQFTLPHPPVIYYGTEVGLSQWHDLEYPDGSRRMEESRTPMLWGNDQDACLLDFYRRLIALRRAHAGLWRGDRRPLVMDEAGLYVTQIGGTAILALNRTNSQVTVTMPVDLAIVLTTDTAVRRDADGLTLPALSGALLLPVGSPP